MNNQKVISEDAIQARMNRLRVELSRRSEMDLYKSLGIEIDLSDESLRTRAIESLQEDYALRDSLGAEMDRRRSDLLDSQPTRDSDPDSEDEELEITTATLWSGELTDEVEHKIIKVIECVFSLTGNFDESEILQVAKVLQDFTINDMEVIDQLNIDVNEV